MKTAITLSALCLNLAAISAVERPPRPNILVFYVDDMGWGSIGPNGQATRAQEGLPVVKTPNLDRLAADGVNFARGYGCTVCSPARSSLQTGFHQGHTFADRNDPDNAKKAIRADDLSIGTVLSRAGYTTGYWGKWGYGGSKEQQDPKILNVQTLPTSHGYQHVLAELHHVRAHTFFQPTLWKAPADDSTGGLKLVRNTMQPFQNELFPASPALQSHVDYPTTAYCDDSYAMEALKFVREQGQVYQKTGTPFHAMLAVQIPHAPFGEITSLPDWNAAYQDDQQFQTLSPQAQQWAAMVTRIDAHFGNILAALEDPNNDGDTSDSVADNTLVLFMSDNGGPAGKNNTELDANGGLRGNKGTIFEGGIRVPLVMRWPAKIHDNSRLKSGSSTSRVVDVTDLLPTFSDLAGVAAPVGIDGVSIAPTLTGDGVQRKRQFVIHEAKNGQSIIRGRHKLIRPPRGTAQLYDLVNDPAEQTNIAARNPKLVKELNSILVAERVREPKGFANTYHSWSGKTGQSTADAQHWTNYIYENNGIVYQKDDGPPRDSWIATIDNTTKQPNVAVGNSDLELLALAVSGNSEGLQTLQLGEGVNLSGRNEIRISDHATIELAGGRISTQRWIDIAEQGQLSGHGTVSGTVDNRGKLKLAQPKGLSIRGNLRLGGTSLVSAVLHDQSSVTVYGTAALAGRLEVSLQGDTHPEPGTSYVLMSAGSVEGQFVNAQNSIATDSGVRMRVEYSASGVTLTVE